MRGARILKVVTVSLVAGLVLAGCARRQSATYVMIDPQTGQRTPVASQTYAQAPVYAQAYPQQPAAPQAQVYAQAYPQQQPSPRAQVYAQQPAYAQQSYAQPQPQAAQPTPDTGERGLFTSRRRSTYVQPQVQAPYVVQYGGGTTYAQPNVGGPYAAPPYAASPYAAYASAPAAYSPSYTLDAGDKLRITVFGQDGITNSYVVDAGGNVNLPLIGTLPARGITTQQLGRLISDRLKQGYVREPHVTVEVETYRPFFILGEVTNPGQYPYVANMTAETAVAIAGGFSPRANKSKIELTRNGGGRQVRSEVPLNTPLRPGDTLVVKERWF